MFQKGAPDNPDILMAYLRGEDVDALLKPRRDAAAEKEAKKGSRGQNTSPRARAAQAEKGREGGRKNSSAAQAEKGRKHSSAAQAEKGRKKRKVTHPDCNPDCAECLQQGKFPCCQCHNHKPERSFDPASWERKARNHSLVCCDCKARTTRKSRRSTKK